MVNHQPPLLDDETVTETKQAALLAFIQGYEYRMTHSKEKDEFDTRREFEYELWTAFEDAYHSHQSASAGQ